MNIDKSKNVFVLDSDGFLYNLLKDEFEYITNSNHMDEILQIQGKIDILFVDIIYQDGDIFEFVKKTDLKPICPVDVTPRMKEKLGSMVTFISKEDILEKKQYIELKKDLVGYEFVQKLLKDLLQNKELLGNMKELYGRYGSPKTIEKNIRYYKEALFDEGVIESDMTAFNKSYPTNTEFFRILLDYAIKQKIKVD